jgi:hypothetical protein
MAITAEQFVQATGREPEMDDLDRCNCPLAGQLGHWFCGWDAEANLPVFMTGRMVSPGLTSQN